MSILRKLLPFGRSKHLHRPEASRFDAPLRPDMDFFVIGDIHGQIQQLGDAIAGIRAMAERPTIICVGDLIDRGEHSAEVLRLLMQLVDAPDLSVICLMGNHEQMCLRFLENPEKHGERWLRYGGLQTLASFRVGLGATRDMGRIRDALAEAMGPEMIAWLRALPLFWVSGNVAVTHAGADPMLPIAMQSEVSLLWGHPDFGAVTRADGVWVVHGHTVVDRANVKPGIISVDTGAYAGGRLSVAAVSVENVSFSEY